VGLVGSNTIFEIKNMLLKRGPPTITPMATVLMKN